MASSVPVPLFLAVKRTQKTLHHLEARSMRRGERPEGGRTRIAGLVLR